LDTLKADDFDALIFVGGFGVAKNLSSFAFDGEHYDADAELIDLIETAHGQGKATGFMCIAPVLAARALGAKSAELTIGSDPDVAKALEAKGAKHIECPVREIVTDSKNRVVSTPAYMLAESILDAEAGINKLVKKVLELA
jgi:enhancing lycopene biosynthesis protein 2